MTSRLVLTRKPLLSDVARWLGPAAGDTVVVTSQGPPLSAESAFRLVRRVPDYGAPEVGALVVDLAREHGVGRIGSLNEVDVIRAAAVRALLGLPGQDSASALAFRDKHVMKSLAAAAGVPVAAMRRAEDVPSARAAAAELGYPVVVKPVAGGGSVGVRVLDGPSRWDTEIVSGPVLVERRIDEAGFYIVDGLMRDGAPTLHVPLDMGTGNFAYADAGLPVAGCSVPLDDPVHAELTDFTVRVLAALPPVAEETAFHLEVFRDRSGGLVLCEIASRAGGMGHAPTFQTVTGVDLQAASLRGQLGLTPREAGPERVAEGAFAGFPRPGGVLRTHPDSLTHPMVSGYRAVAEVGKHHPPSRWVGDDAASVLVRAPLGTDVREVLADVVAEYHQATTWR